MTPFEKAFTEAYGEPFEKQQKFYESIRRYVGYGGAKFGGKSHGIRGKATLLAFEHPGIQMLIVRRTLPELRENHTLEFEKEYARFPADLRPTYKDSTAEFWYPTGSRLKLGYCKDESDVTQYQGQAYDIAFVDEATHFTELQFYWIDMCVGRREGIYPQRTYVTCNPGGPGHAWVKRRFIDRKFIGNEEPDEHEFIYAYAWDNLPMLLKDKGYMAEIKRLCKEHGVKKITPEIAKAAILSSKYARQLSNLPKALREALLYGRWDVYAGQYFSEFDPNIHVIKPFRIPDTWRRSAALDYGLDMFAVLCFATDARGHSYVYKEIGISNLTIPQAAEKFKREIPEHLDIIYAPPDMWNRRQDTGRSVANIFTDYGIPLVRAGNSRIDGWANVKENLEIPINDDGTKGQPIVTIFETCSGIIEDIPELQSDPKKPDDVAAEPHEHTHRPDALRYWSSMRHLKSKLTKKSKSDPWGMNKPKRSAVNGYLMGGY